MKKFYSFVLMAAALLIGTNLQAATFSGNTAAELQDAIYAIMSGATSDPVIKLSQPVDLDRTIWVGTKDEGDDFKSITIDLNGKNITMNGVRDSKNKRVLYVMFSLTHGELKVINSSADEAKVQLTGETADNSRIFEVFGSYRSSRWNENGTDLVADSVNTRVRGWFTHLEIGKNVMLYAGPGCLAEGIAIGVQNYRTYWKDASTKATTTYRGDVFNNTWGFAQGARVDFWGKMDIQGAEDGKVYGFSTKGLLRSALSCSKDKATKPETLNTNHGTNYASNYYNYNGTIAETNGVTHKLDTLDAPFIWIHPESEITVRNDGDKVAAIYAAGYAKWLVQGYAAGKTGMYASSGTVDLQDAYVKSTANVWENTDNIGSANGGGSGVVLNSRDSYAGDMDFVVSGDTKIESVKGYAIEEAVNTTTLVPNPKADPENPEYKEGPAPYIPASNVSNVSIESGTIAGGDKGAIVISGPTSDATASTNPDAKSTVVVYGGNVTGTTTVGVNPEGLDELLPDQGDYHQTEIEVGGKTVIVISQGETPATDTESEFTTWAFIKGKADEAVAAEEDAPSYQWTKKEDAEITSGVVLLGELQITSGTGTAEGARQQLTIANGATLQVERLVMNSYARIIVEAGGKLIVTGGQGINAPVVDNILLKASETAQATFLFAPGVASNRHPNAKVEYHSNSFYNGHNVQQFFGLPTYNGGVTNIETSSEAKIYFDLWRNPNWDYIGAMNASGEPSVLANLNKFDLPFGLLCITSKNDADHKPVFTFSGELTGNIDHNFTLYQGWTSMSNAYMGPIDKNAIIDQLAAWNANYGTEQNVYTYDLNSETGAIQWHAKNKYSLPVAGIKAMSPIMFHNGSTVGGIVLDYSDLVWDPLFPDQNLAPARQAVSSITKVKINIAGENEADYTTIIEDSELGDDRSFCAPKYDNAGLQLYVMGNEKYDIYATDEIENSYIGYRTAKAGMYTISFENVEGEDLVLVDLVNGTRTNMTEGAVYTFNAEANESNDYRFEIVGAAKMPTAIENTEVKANAKGVYTLTGQYLGNVSIFNALPAGVYVVDGMKKVK